MRELAGAQAPGSCRRKDQRLLIQSRNWRFLTMSIQCTVDAIVLLKDGNCTTLMNEYLVSTGFYSKMREFTSNGKIVRLAGHEIDQISMLGADSLTSVELLLVDADDTFVHFIKQNYEYHVAYEVAASLKDVLDSYIVVTFEDFADLGDRNSLEYLASAARNLRVNRGVHTTTLSNLKILAPSVLPEWNRETQD